MVRDEDGCVEDDEWCPPVVPLEAKAVSWLYSPQLSSADKSTQELVILVGGVSLIFFAFCVRLGSGR